eukprot:7316904-Heterocapsa_arctica.AAC.1
MEHMDGKEDNIFTIDGFACTFKEHPIEVARTMLESILGLGAIFEDYGFTELEDLPEMVVEIEEGLKRNKFQITQDDKERLALGRIRRDLGFRR